VRTAELTTGADKVEAAANEDMVEAQARVKCPRCGAESPVGDVLARSTDSWPNQRWLLSPCASCGSGVHLEVSNGHLEVGELDGAPGPCFMPTQKLEVPGLGVKVRTGGITVTFDGVRRVVPAAR
jgi:endogenous inhibitor of DNA gyrase (YacG/DUF329 family)